MGFGLYNAPATFARAINLVLHLLNWKIALAFLEDVLILQESTQPHLDKLRQVFERFQQYGSSSLENNSSGKKLSFWAARVAQRGSRLVINI